jgi:hypothetical protein
MVAFSFRFTACLQSRFADESVPHDLSFFICGGTTFSPNVPGFPSAQTDWQGTNRVCQDSWKIEKYGYENPR